jgi:hypothetical protein
MLSFLRARMTVPKFGIEAGCLLFAATLVMAAHGAACVAHDAAFGSGANILLESTRHSEVVSTFYWKARHSEVVLGKWCQRFIGKHGKWCHVLLESTKDTCEIAGSEPDRPPR